MDLIDSDTNNKITSQSMAYATGNTLCRKKERKKKKIITSITVHAQRAPEREEEAWHEEAVCATNYRQRPSWGTL